MRAFLFWGMCLLGAVVLHAQHYAFRQYGPREGLLNIEVRCLLQDRTGFLWVGTENGLFRFDGKQFLRFGVEQGLPDVWIQALHQSNDGTLWVGTRYGIATLKQGRAQIVVPGPVRGRSAQSITSTENGEVYLATDQGALKATQKGGRWEIEPAAEALRRPMGAIYLDGKNFWFTSENVLWRYTNGSVRQYSVKEGLPDTEVWTSILRSKRGDLYVRSRNSVHVLCSSCSGFKPVDHVPAVNVADHLVLDPNGEVIIPTDQGALQSNGSVWLGRTQGLPDDPVSSLLWDREGALWIGTGTHGLWRWSGSKEWENFDDREGLASNIVSAIHRSESGVLWIGTRHGLHQIKGSRIKLASQALWAQEIRGIRSGDGGVFVGSSNYGLVRIDEHSGVIRQFNAADGLESQKIIGLDRTGSTLWVYTRGGVFLADIGAFQHAHQTGRLFRRWDALERIAPETRKQSVYRVRKDSRNRLWVAALAGLYVEDHGQWRHFGTKDGLLQAAVPNLTIDRQDRLWVTYSADLGISRLTYEGGKLAVENFTRDHGNNITFAETDQQGSVWIGTDNGVVAYRDGEWSHYGIDEGLIWQDTEFNAFYSDRDGSLWIGTTRGLAHYRPGKKVRKLAPPSVVLTGIAVNEQWLNPAMIRDPIHSGSTVKLSFSALSFIDSERIRFRYRLLGLDDRWIDHDNGEIVFPRLEYGKYRFEVMALHTHKNWKSSITGLDFAVAPYWWQTSWSLVTGLLLLSLVITGTWRWRVRTLLGQKKALEEAVAWQTREIRDEKSIVELQKQQIEHLLVEARQANKLKDEFLANISHEIRTPLHGVLGMTDLVLSTELTEEQREYLQLADTSASSLLHLLNDLLDFSKIEAGKLALENVPFSLRECMDSASGAMAVFAREKGLSFLCTVDDDLKDTAFGDPGRLRQVLSNLISNAVKFTESGSITIKVTRDEKFDKTGRISFVVRDTGPGIPPEKWGAIFEPFRQADGSTTRKFGGTGLGLSICNRLATLMKGELELESEVGRGTTFTFVVPLSNASANQPGDAGSKNPDQDRCVLLVEDNPVNLKLGAYLLDREGCTVVTAVNGREALTLLTKSHFDFVFVDLQMPDMDGIAVVEELRRRETGQEHRTPVIIVTASASLADRNRAFAAGVEAYLMKPVRREDLQQVLAVHGKK